MRPGIPSVTLRAVNTGRWKGAKVAVKVLCHRSQGDLTHTLVAREAIISAATSHPNVVVE